MPKHAHLHAHLSKFRYEFLLAALLLLIFDKIFVPSATIYLDFVWPLNMVIISLACFGIFHEANRHIIRLRNCLCVMSIAMPFMFIFLRSNSSFVLVLTFFYILFYAFIFAEVMRQITLTKEVRLNVLIGSFCGYLLLSMVVVFCFVLVEILVPLSFHGLSADIASKYNELSYFSFITLTSIGFGDIYPQTDSSRLTVAFFGMAGQFYMAAVIGIIISKFTSNNA